LVTRQEEPRRGEKGKGARPCQQGGIRGAAELAAHKGSRGASLKRMGTAHPRLARRPRLQQGRALRTAEESDMYQMEQNEIPSPRTPPRKANTWSGGVVGVRSGRCKWRAEGRSAGAAPMRHTGRMCTNAF
jgi:hypothetical protein